MKRIEVDMDSLPSLPCPFCGRTQGYVFHQHHDLRKQTAARHATCLQCRGTIELPDPRSPQWKDPNRCVRRAFAQAKRKTRARTAIQNATPRTAAERKPA